MMIGKTYRVLAFATLLAGVAVHASASSIVTDGGFESGLENVYTGDMGDGWIVTAGTGAICNDISAVACGNAGSAHTGNQMAFLDWANTFDTISQTLNTIVGQTYIIDYFVAGTQPNLLDVTFGGSTLFNGTSPTGGVDSTDYVEYTFNATATSTSTVLAFSGERTLGAGEILLDDVSVSPTPEPSALFLTGLALVAAMLFRNRAGCRSSNALVAIS